MADYLLDTNVIILLFRNDRKAKQTISMVAQLGDVSISAITRAEIVAGMKLVEEKTTLALLNSFTTIPVDSVIADQAGKLIFQHARQGFPLSFPDALIAATALIETSTLVTTNIKHFEHVGAKVRPL